MVAVAGLRDLFCQDGAASQFRQLHKWVAWIANQVTDQMIVRILLSRIDRLGGQILEKESEIGLQLAPRLGLYDWNCSSLLIFQAPTNYADRQGISATPHELTAVRPICSAATSKTESEDQCIGQQEYGRRFRNRRNIVEIHRPI